MLFKSEEHSNTVSNTSVKATPDFEQIKSLVKSHYQYLLSHKLYIKRIIDNQISDTDIEAYAKDVFGIHVGKHVQKILCRAYLGY